MDALTLKHEVHFMDGLGNTVVVAAFICRADAEHFMVDSDARYPGMGDDMYVSSVHIEVYDDGLDYDAAAECNSVPSTNEYSF